MISPFELYAIDCAITGIVRTFDCSLLRMLHIRNVRSDPQVANWEKIDEKNIKWRKMLKRGF